VLCPLQLDIMEYADKHGVREAGRHYAIDHSNIVRWYRQRYVTPPTVLTLPGLQAASLSLVCWLPVPPLSREQYEKEVRKRQKKTVHSGADSKRAEMEAVLRTWLMRRRARTLPVTKQMLINKAMVLDPTCVLLPLPASTPCTPCLGSCSRIMPLP
jgi:hypothetical protein